jgi:hypothetical protein
LNRRFSFFYDVEGGSPNSLNIGFSLKFSLKLSFFYIDILFKVLGEPRFNERLHTILSISRLLLIEPQIIVTFIFLKVTFVLNIGICIFLIPIDYGLYLYKAVRK